MCKASITSITAIAILLLVAPLRSTASTCSAHNDSGDTCNVDCSAGQEAKCSNGSGASSPTCECRDASGFKPWFKSGPGIFSGMLSPLGTPSNAIQSTNAADILNAKLAQQRDVSLRQECRQVETGERVCREKVRHCVLRFGPEPPAFDRCVEQECAPVTVQQCTNVSGKLQLSGPIVVENEPEVVVREPNWDGIPTDVIGRKLTYTNCSTEKQTNTVSVTQEVTRGSRVQMTKAVSTTNSISAKIEFEFAISAEVNASFSQKIDTSSTSEQNYQTREVLPHTDTVILPPMSLTTYTVSWRRMEVPVFFSGIATVDGPVTQNLENIKLASQLLTAAEDRELAFEGAVYNTTVMSADVVNHATPLTVAECAKRKPSSVVSEPLPRP